VVGMSGFSQIVCREIHSVILKNESDSECQLNYNNDEQQQNKNDNPAH
jgi:hypothetical protein